MVQKNSSEFAILMENKNSCSFFFTLYKLFFFSKWMNGIPGLCWHWNRFEICSTSYIGDGHIFREGKNISFSLLIDLISILWFQAWSLDLAHSQWTVWNVCGLIVYPWKCHYYNTISLLLLFFIQRVISNLHTIIDYFPNPIANWQGQKRIP